MYEKIIRRDDGSYVITKHGYLYHIPNNEEFASEFAQVDEYANTHPEVVEKEQPVQSKTLTLEDAKADKLAEINEQYETLAKQAQVDVPDSEMLTWDIQKSEAEAYQQDSSSPTPFIDTLALGRNMDKVELIEKILAKAVQYQQFIGLITGIRQQAEDMLKQADNTSDLLSISFMDIYQTYAGGG